MNGLHCAWYRSTDTFKLRVSTHIGMNDSSWIFLQWTYLYTIFSICIVIKYSYNIFSCGLHGSKFLLLRLCHIFVLEFNWFYTSIKTNTPLHALEDCTWYTVCLWPCTNTRWISNKSNEFYNNSTVVDYKVVSFSLEII